MPCINNTIMVLEFVNWSMASTHIRSKTDVSMGSDNNIESDWPCSTRSRIQIEYEPHRILFLVYVTFAISISSFQFGEPCRCLKQRTWEQTLLQLFLFCHLLHHMPLSYNDPNVAVAKNSKQPRTHNHCFPVLQSWITNIYKLNGFVGLVLIIITSLWNVPRLSSLFFRDASNKAAQPPPPDTHRRHVLVSPLSYRWLPHKYDSFTLHTHTHTPKPTPKPSCSKKSKSNL